MSNQTITADEVERFTTNNRREIIFYLNQLIGDGERVSVIFNSGNDTLLTVLLHVDEENDTLVFDWGSSEETNRRLLRSDRNLFLCAPHGVRNQFATGAVREITYRGRPAFATQIPRSYTRLQRREFFRLVLPITRRPLCHIPREGSEPIALSVVDISIGGIALEIPGSQPPFEIGEILKGARIDLKGVGPLTVDLEVRNRNVIQRGDKSFGRVGCNFLNLSRGMEGQLQRFITEVQREARARMGG